MFSILNHALSWAVTSFGNKFCPKKRSRLIQALDNRFYIKFMQLEIGLLSPCPLGLNSVHYGFDRGLLWWEGSISKFQILFSSVPWAWLSTQNFLFENLKRHKTDMCWRFFSFCFMHVDWDHLSMAMFLYLGGFKTATVESVLGFNRFYRSHILYLVSDNIFRLCSWPEFSVIVLSHYDKWTLKAQVCLWWSVKSSGI